MTFRKWWLLYQAYKNNYDMEFVMKVKKLRYSDLEIRKHEVEEIINW